MQTAETRRKPVVQEEQQPVPLPTEPVQWATLQRLGKPHDLYRVDISRHDPSHCRIDIRRKMDKEAATAHFERLYATQKQYSDHEMRQGCEKLLREMTETLNKSITLITDSFFLLTTPEGQIIGGDEITRRYE
jgi:hypothetical protein